MRSPSSPLLPLLALAAALALPLAAGAQAQPQAPTPAQPRGNQKGTVMVRVEDDSTAAVLKGARVRVVGGEEAASWLTGDDGTARLRNVPAGERVVQASMAGYAMRGVTVEVLPGGTRSVVIELAPQVEEVMLEGLNVTSWGRSVVLRGNGFYERKENWNGSFLTRDDVLQRHPARLPDVFRQVRGFTVARAASREILTATRRQSRSGFCPPRVYLNGVRIPGSSSDVLAHLNNIPPNEVEGVEAYPSASSIPPQYSAADSGCGLILIWTRSTRRF